MSIRTKKELAKALKVLICERSFDKISVTDIADQCYVNRQTFYYHFQDKYECLSWIFQFECFDRFKTTTSLESWNRNFVKMLKTMKSDRLFYTRAIEASSLSFIYPLVKVLRKRFEEAMENIDKKNDVLKEEEVSVSEFLAYGSTGIILDWVVNDMKEDPEEMANRLISIAVNVEKLSHQVNIDNEEHEQYSKKG